jgi:outer membrane receptor protein involved in Fe transport
VLIRVALGSLCLATIAHAQPVDDSTQVVESMHTDEIGAPGLRPITGLRLEALLSTGSYGTHRAVGRATATSGGFGFEVDGSLVDSDGFIPVAEHDRGAVDHRAALSGHEAGARVEHDTELHHARAFGRYLDEHRDGGAEHQNTDARVARYGGRWTRSGARVYLDLQAFGEVERLHEERPRILPDRSSALLASEHSIPLTTHGARAAIKSRRLHAFGADHELVLGGGLVLASGEAEATITPSLDTSTHMRMGSSRIRGDHRFLDAYIEDTVRFIRTLDVSGGLVIERWSNLGGDSRLAYGLGEPMDDQVPDVSQLLVSPSIGVTEHVTDQVALRARTYRNMRTPTMEELYRPVMLGDSLTDANSTLLPEKVWTTEVGPEITWGRLTARAAMFASTVENAISSVTTTTPLGDGATRQRQNIGTARVRGIDSEASWRPAKAWLATVSYTFATTEVTASERYGQLVGKQLAQMPRQRATAMLTFDDPRIATITGALRYMGHSFEDDTNSTRLGGYALVDAMASRTLHGGLAGFIAVENLLDRRYLVGRTGVDTIGAPRMFQVGVKIDSDRF